MTLEELKIEAKKHGYFLVKSKEKEKLLPCTCGGVRRANYIMWDGQNKKYVYTLRCKRCGNRVSGDSEYSRNHNWNELIRYELSQKEKE